MADICWLVSYPKSGNTWLRILLINYMLNLEAPIDINRLDSIPIASARIWFDEWAGIEASALSSRLIARIRPEIYRCMAREAQQRLILKVHDSWSLTDEGQGMFPPEVTAGVIYVVRNPLDIAASFANHTGVTIDRAVENLCNQDYSLACSVGRFHDQLHQQLGSWSRHVSSWLDDAGLNVHLVRYEDLQVDTITYFGEVVRFCGLEYDEQRLQKAAQFSDFQELQRQEREKGFKERSRVAPDAFFRKGESGGWREELSTDQIRKIIDVNGEIMLRFGYLDSKYQPA